jgi:hypothetical protein
MCKLFGHQQQKLRTRKQFDFTFVICSYEINLIRLKAVFFGESSAVGDQKVCTKSKLNFKYNKQTFWNTNGGGKNTNSNTLERWISIYTGLDDASINISDINNDGYNDILVFTKVGGLKIYKNNSGSGFSAGYDYSENVFAVSTGDFNKDGWNDLVINTESTVEIFLNTKTGDYFNETASFIYENTFPVATKLYYGGRSMVADLYNKGGLALIFSAIPDATNGNWNAEYVFRINASDTDAVPAPSVQFRSYFLKNGIYRPRIYMYNRGDRDFNKYRIYKRTPRLPDSLVYIGETTSNSFIDTTEYITENPAGAAPTTFNCIYFSTCTDFTSHESTHSDTAKYLVGDDEVCMECSEGGDAMLQNTGQLSIQTVESYNVTNFPNPFNPVSKIYYTIPIAGYVRIVVYNSMGQTVKELVNEFKGIGSHTAEFDGTGLSSGIYYYKISSGSFESVRKMVLIK